MAGEFKVNGVSFATESGGTLTVNNSKVRLPSSGNGIEDSSGNSVLSESGGNVSLTAKNATVTGDFVPSQPMMFRNKVINGAMLINQRGSTAVSAGTNNVFSVDRFNVGLAGGTAAYTLNNTAEAPSGSGFSKSFHIDVTTADTSMDASHGYYLRYKFEGQELQDLCKGTSSSKEVTLSFWVKSPKSGIHIIELFDLDNTRHISKSYNVASADTWQKIIINFAGDTTGSLDNDNLASFTIHWWLAAGTDFSGGTLNTSWNAYVGPNRAVGQVNIMDDTSNNFYITGVQFELGSSATPFEHRPIGTELGLCQRYFEKVEYSIGAVGGTVSTRKTRFPFRFAVDKRATPAVTISSSAVIRCNTPTATEVYTTSATISTTNTHTNGDDYSAQGSFTAAIEL